MKRTVMIFLLCLFLSCAAQAHPGRTDSNGGHTEHATGQYHYHHGCPEHQHEGGMCPYNFYDPTGGSGYYSGAAADTLPVSAGDVVPAGGTVPEDAEAVVPEEAEEAPAPAWEELRPELGAAGAGAALLLAALFVGRPKE